ncbi:MAG TPA: gamma-glutamyl-gamma-aminobutyrate hydrolase family protein, partial [Planctomycetia bacterium]|nr:gamma-glutamyl-gamma-aminobutyrate hydrolase family protein [Planctomycetia bacterium]
AFGGTLYQDLASQCDAVLKHDYFPVQGYPDRGMLVHDVTVRPDTRLARILGATSAPVNSMHHQGIKDLGAGLVASAVAPDGVIEGVEGSNCHFVVGVQWHPEELVETSSAMYRLFEAFVAAAREFRAARASG